MNRRSFLGKAIGVVAGAIAAGLGVAKANVWSGPGTIYGKSLLDPGSADNRHAGPLDYFVNHELTMPFDWTRYTGDGQLLLSAAIEDFWNGKAIPKYAVHPHLGTLPGTPMSQTAPAGQYELVIREFKQGDEFHELLAAYPDFAHDCLDTRHAGECLNTFWHRINGRKPTEFREQIARARFALDYRKIEWPVSGPHYEFGGFVHGKWFHQPVQPLAPTTQQLAPRKWPYSFNS
jgi:hypothetical protein